MSQADKYQPSAAGVANAAIDSVLTDAFGSLAIYGAGNVLGTADDTHEPVVTIGQSHSEPATAKDVDTAIDE